MSSHMLLGLATCNLLSAVRVAYVIYIQRHNEKKKSTLPGVTTGASAPRSSLRQHQMNMLQHTRYRYIYCSAQVGKVSQVMFAVTGHSA